MKNGRKKKKSSQKFDSNVLGSKSKTYSSNDLPQPIPLRFFQNKSSRVVQRPAIAGPGASSLFANVSKYYMSSHRTHGDSESIQQHSGGPQWLRVTKLCS